MGCGGIGEGLETGGRDVVAGHEALGEILGGFELRGFPGRAEDLQAAGAEDVDHAGGQRRFRADHGQVDLVLLGEVSQASGSVMLTFSSSCSRAVPALPGATQTFCTPGAGPASRPGVFAAAGADDEDFMGGS
jgi:hypothetical protein